MTWEQLILALKHVLGSDEPTRWQFTFLPMGFGAQNDNGYEDEPVQDYNNNGGTLLSGNFDAVDWVCVTFRYVRMYKANTGMNFPGLPKKVGHPVLADRGQVICAGRIDTSELFGNQPSFIFWSGHYRPIHRHVLEFLLAFTHNSVSGLTLSARRNELDRLSDLKVTYFVSQKSDETVTTTIGDLILSAIAGISTFTPTTTSGNSPGHQRTHERRSSYELKMQSPFSNNNNNNNNNTGTSPKRSPWPQQIANNNSAAGNTISKAQSNLSTSMALGMTPDAQRISNTNAQTGSAIPVPSTGISVSKCQACSGAFNAYIRKLTCAGCGKVICYRCTDEKIKPDTTTVRCRNCNSQQNAA